MENYGKQKEAFLRQFLELPNRMTSHDAIKRVYKRLDQHKFGQACMSGQGNCSLFWTLPTQRHARKGNSAENLATFTKIPLQVLEQAN